MNEKNQPQQVNPMSDAGESDFGQIHRDTRSQRKRREREQEREHSPEEKQAANNHKIAATQNSKEKKASGNKESEQKISAPLEEFEINDSSDPQILPSSSSSSSSSSFLIPQPSAISCSGIKTLHEATHIVETTQKSMIRNEMWKYSQQKLNVEDELARSFTMNMQSGILTHSLLYVANSNPSYEIEEPQPQINLPAHPESKETSLQQTYSDPQQEIQILKIKLAATQEALRLDSINYNSRKKKDSETIAKLVREKKEFETSSRASALVTNNRIKELEETIKKTTEETKKELSVLRANEYLSNHRAALAIREKQEAEQEKIKLEITSNRRIIDFIVSQKINDIETKIKKLKEEYIAKAKTALRNIEDPEEILCPISTSPITDPVAIVGSTKIYDRTSIEQWFRLNNATCPLSNIKLTTDQHKELLPLPALKRAIEAYLQCKNEVSIDLSPSSSLSTSINSGKFEVESSMLSEFGEFNLSKSEKEEEKSKAESKTNTSPFDAGFFGNYTNLFATTEEEFSAQMALAMELSDSPSTSSNENAFGRSNSSSSSSSSS
jgi:hypothetical protein